MCSQMKYIIQIFKPSAQGDFRPLPGFKLLGQWSNTNGGGDDEAEVLARAEEISKVPNRPFSHVRVLKLLVERKCQYDSSLPSTGEK